MQEDRPTRTGGQRACVSCKSTRLSRYNLGPLCGPCRQAARDARDITPTWIWDSAPMRRALSRVDVPAVVALVRAAAGLSQEELGHLVAGWSQSTVSRIEKGTRGTLYDIRELLACADAVDMPREALAPLILGDPDATLADGGGTGGTGGGETDGIEREEGDQVDRWDFNGMAAGPAAAAALPAFEVPARVDDAHVRYLRASLDRLRARDQELGGGAVFTQARRQFARARRMLDESDYSERVGHRLLVVTGELAEEAGWAAFDSGDQVSARAFYNEAHVLAGSSGDTELQTHILSTMAMQANHLAWITRRKGVAREARRLAELAAGIAEHEPSPRLRALVAIRLAVAYANDGDAGAFRRAVARAREELDRGEHPADLPWTAFVTPGEVDAAEATGHLSLGAPGRSVEIHRKSLEDAALGPRNRLCATGYLANALLHQGDVGEAIRTGLSVITGLSGGMTSARPLARLRAVRGAAERAGHEEFCSRFDAAAHGLAV
ncbi:helix-turn-helix transcriptional regulator [Spirillospora sp. CA-255316]